MAGPTRAWAVANDPDHEWTLRWQLTRNPHRSDNYIAGQPGRRPTDASDVLDVTNPATGETLARVPLSGCGRPRRGGHGRARGAAAVA